MLEFTDRLAAIISITSVVCLLTGLLGLWLWFGLATWFLVTLLLALGPGKASRRWPLLPTLAVILMMHWGLFCAIAWLHDPAGGPRLLLGLPLGTALVIYVPPLLGLTAAILYGRYFDRWILPSDRLERFLAEFGRPKGDG